MAIPACFVISKILVPETEKPLTLGMLPEEKAEDNLITHEDGTHELQTIGGELIDQISPLDSAIIGALDGVKMSVAIAAILILILGLLSLVNQFSAWLGLLPSPAGDFFQVVTLANILGFIFYPVTILTGVPFEDSWTASVIIGRRLLETAIPPYQALAEAAKAGSITPRTVLIVSYALSGFAHVASVGIFVGGMVGLVPSRRKDISELGWKALLGGTLATLMIACLAGFYDNGNPSIMGEPAATPPAISTPAAPNTTVSPAPTPAPKVSPSPKS